MVKNICFIFIFYFILSRKHFIKIMKNLKISYYLLIILKLIFNLLIDIYFIFSRKHFIKIIKNLKISYYLLIILKLIFKLLIDIYFILNFFLILSLKIWFSFIFISVLIHILLNVICFSRKYFFYFK